MTDDDLEATQLAAPAPQPPRSDASDHAAHGDAPAHLRLGALLGLVLLLTVVGSLVAQHLIAARVVPADDWERAALALRDAYEPGDIVRVEPVWADTPRVFLDGATFDLTPQPTRDVLDEYQRIWVLAGFNRADDVAATMPEVYTRLSVETFGAVDLLLYEVPTTARPKLDFMELLAEARVRRVWPDNRPAQDCQLWRDDAWHCGRIDPHLYAGRRMRDMNNEPRYCIYAPPIPDNGWLEITFDDIDLDRELSGRVGLDNWAVRSERGGVTDFEVHIDGTPRFATRIEPRDPEFYHWSVDTSDVSEGEHTVTFRTHATDFFDRFLCFTARIPAS